MPKRKITQDDVMAIRYVTDAALSPDGTQAVYVRADVTGKGEKEKQVLSIWQVATDGQGSPRRLTRGNSSAWAPAWSTDGNGIYFVSSRDKVPQVYYLPLDGGEAEAVTAFEFGVASFKVNPRRRELVVSASTKAPPTYGDDDHWRIGRSWYRFDPMPGVLLQDLEQALYVVRHSGGRPRELMRTQGMIVEGNISPDGNRVAIVVMGTAEHAFFDADLVLLATRGQPSATTVIRNRPLAGVTWAGNDSILLTSPRRDIADQSTLYVVDPGTGTMADRTSSMDLMVGTGVNGHSPVRLQSAMFAEDDGTVLTTVSRGGSVNVESISLKGRRQATALTEGQQVCHLKGVADEVLLVIRQAPNEPHALYAVSRETGAMTRLTNDNEKELSGLQLPSVHHFTTRTAPGVEVEGWLLAPRHRRPPYRTLLVIHGGPHAAYGFNYSFDFQAFVGAGYAVAYMNPRGSTGYGTDFARSIIGQWGDPEFRDFNAFLDRLVADGLADPDRLGVTGISGGGHLSGWLIGHTNRFRAAVPEQGVYNMLSMWGTSDAGVRLIELEMGGKPDRMPMTYWERSPVAYARRCKTPTLLIQGEEDIRCPMEQAEQMYMALREAGCETELVRLRNCAHGSQIGGRPALRRYRMDILLDWFDKHMK